MKRTVLISAIFVLVSNQAHNASIKHDGESDPVISVELRATNQTCYLVISLSSDDTNYHVRTDEIIFPNEKTRNQDVMMIVSGSYHVNAVGLVARRSDFGALTATNEREMSWLWSDYVTPARHVGHHVTLVYRLDGMQEVVRREQKMDSVIVTLAEIVPQQYDAELSTPTGLYIFSDPYCVIKVGGTTRFNYSSRCDDPCVPVHDDEQLVSHRYVIGAIRRDFR
ncbi:MAG TPA: hypothetical protein DIS79_08595 [Bacteroidetes bacterium]|nr:hypothetical protein [Bacteroidota bacterium]HRK06106.1 hypothetical protein [Chlorobiota bacterium]